MKRGTLRAMSVVVCTSVVLLLAGCGGSTTPDTEGQTLAQAQQALRDAGVPDSNITVNGPQGDPNQLIVCDHDPDSVAPTQPVTLEVDTACADDADKKKKRKKPGSSSNRSRR